MPAENIPGRWVDEKDGTANDSLAGPYEIVAFKNGSRNAHIGRPGTGVLDDLDRRRVLDLVFKSQRSSSLRRDRRTHMQNEPAVNG
ncbi:MAG TPA: hypothetical protein VG899_15780 [Mycobacteriales bacterium]|nr:hypothetical protein [Mycobacteriales bacterium]